MPAAWLRTGLAARAGLVLFMFFTLFEVAGRALDYGSPNVGQELLGDFGLVIGGVSDDPEYGHVPEKPVMVGNGGDFMNGPQYEQRFLNSLAGPKGEALSWRRRGSAHPFATENAPLPFGGGMLDVYEVTYPGLGEPILLYLNMYDSDLLLAPVGFAVRAAK